MKNKYLVLSFFGFIYFLTLAQNAHAKTFESKLTQVNMLELYTSEGCSSCPPAEAWLSTFQIEKELWEDIIPIAFHVTYWDYLGWKDRLGSTAFADRQRDYAAHWGSKSVYTPGFVFNGKEWRSWGGQKNTLTSYKPQAPVGKLTLKPLGQNQYKISFKPLVENSDLLTGELVLLGFGIESKIKRGENRGKGLVHDFAALAHETNPLQQKDGEFSAIFKLEGDSKFKASRYALAAWVHQENNPTPIQAVGGYL